MHDNVKTRKINGWLPPLYATSPFKGNNLTKKCKLKSVAPIKVPSLDESSFSGVFLSVAETILSSQVFFCDIHGPFNLSVLQHLEILLVRNTKETTSSDNQTLDCSNIAFCVVP